LAKVVIYTTPFCPYCSRAKSLLKRKGVDFQEIDVMMDSGKRQEMVQLAKGRQTVPQIFIDGEGIGGSDELHALEAQGKLDALLAA
jgi:glutaredoxin 3